ncbi:MAG TPA: response regulator [Chloroflexi bacterium]|nr:response regulator [Chloroflexota bacterium]
MNDTIRILYIEDDPGNRMLVRRILEAEGFSITEATDGPSGLEIATEMYPDLDLILLDINLPEIDGYDLAKRFRNTPTLQEVPILAVTANVMQGDRELTLEAGCDGYIQKPIDVDLLPEQVKAALKMKHTQRPQ